MNIVLKRTISLLLSLLLCTGLLPVAALAEAPETDVPDEPVAEILEQAEEPTPAEEPAEEPAPEDTEEPVACEPLLSEEAALATAPTTDTDLLSGSTWIPDESFRAALQYVLGCSSLTLSEAAAVRNLYISNSNIHDLTGIQYFTALETLKCDGNSLNKLDLSALTKLSELSCEYCSLTELKLPNSTALYSVDCSSNDLTELDLSTCTGLTKLSCSYNKLLKLDLSKCTKLTKSGFSAFGQEPDSSYYRVNFYDLGSGWAVADLRPIFGSIDYSGYSFYDYYYQVFGEMFVTPTGLCLAEYGQEQRAAFESVNLEDGVLDPGMIFKSNLLDASRDGLRGYLAITMTSAPDAIAPSFDYLLLKPDESASLSVCLSLPDSFNDFKSELSVKPRDSFSGSAGEDAAAVVKLLGDDIIALTTGSATVRAVVTVPSVGKDIFSFTCRVDITENPEQEITAVSLLDTSVSLNIYSKTNATFRILPELDMLTATVQQLYDATNPDFTIAAAEFVDSKAAGSFSLRVLDDRTLEIVPDQTAVAAGIKGTFQSQVRVTLKGGRELTTSSKLKLTVTNTLPTVKAASVAFNTFADNQKIKLSLTGPAVESISVVSKPEWLSVDTAARTVSLTTDAPDKASGELVLDCSPADYTAAVRVKVPVKLSYTEPKLKLSKSSLTIMSGGGYDNLDITLTPETCENLPLTVTRITEGKLTYSEDYFPIDIESYSYKNTYSVYVNSKDDDGTDHTYKVYFSAGGKETALTVKVKSLLSRKPKVSISGTISTGIVQSCNTVTMSVKDYSGHFSTDFAAFTIGGIYIKSDTGYVLYSDAGEYFYYSDSTFYANTANPGNAAATNIYMKGAENSLPKNTYYVQVKTRIYDGNSGTLKECETIYLKLNIKFPSKPTSGKMTLKATALNIYEGDCVAVLNAAITDHNNYNKFIFTVQKTYDADTGKTVTDTPEEVQTWFELKDLQINTATGKSSAGVYLTEAGKAYVKPGDKYRFTLTTSLFIYPYLAYIYTPVEAAVTVTVKGSAKVTANNKAELLKKDRFDSSTVVLTVTGGTIDTIKVPQLDAKSAKYYAASWSTNSFGETVLLLRWKDSNINPAAKSGSVKVGYYMVGNNSQKVTGTVSVKLTLK